MTLRELRPYRMVRVALVIAAAVIRYAWLRLRAGAGIAAPSPTAWERAHRRTGQSIARLANRLGGAFVKIGQVLGARADVFPAAFIEPLRQLHDRVPARPFSALREHVERELGARVDAVFANIDDRALAAASLAQVHRARLRSGDDVVIKIQYPEASRLFPTDLRSLRAATRVLRWMNRALDLRAMADELASFIELELDFAREARSTERARAALRDMPGVRVPRVETEYSRGRVLVLEHVPGRAISDVAGLRAAGVDLEALAARVAAVYCRMIFEHGFFHGDPHPGNILVADDGSIALIDFGLAKELPDGFAAGVASMMLCAAAGDAAGAVGAARTIGFELSGDPARFLDVIRLILGDRSGVDRVLQLLETTGLDAIPPHFTLIVRVFILLNGLSHLLVPGRRVIPLAVVAAMAPHVGSARAAAAAAGR